MQAGQFIYIYSHALNANQNSQSLCWQECLQNLELETQHLARDIFSTEQSLHLFLSEKEQTEVGNSSLKLMAFFFPRHRSKQGDENFVPSPLALNIIFNE